MPHNQRTEGKAIVDIAQEMTREEKIAEVKKKIEKIRKKRQRQRERARKNYTPPRYDDVYFEGLQYLDSLDCPPEFSKVATEQFWELI